MKATRLLTLAFIAGCTASDDVHAPMIASINPDHAAAGTSVTIQGDYFCQQPATPGEVDPLACANTGTVTFGPMQGLVGMYTEQVISAEVPSLEAGTYSVSVSVAGRASNAVSFRVDVP